MAHVPTYASDILDRSGNSHTSNRSREQQQQQSKGVAAGLYHFPSMVPVAGNSRTASSPGPPKNQPHDTGPPDLPSTSSSTEPAHLPQSAFQHLSEAIFGRRSTPYPQPPSLPSIFRRHPETHIAPNMLSPDTPSSAAVDNDRQQSGTPLSGFSEPGPSSSAGPTGPIIKQDPGYTGQQAPRTIVHPHHRPEPLLLPPNPYGFPTADNRAQADHYDDPPGEREAQRSQLVHQPSAPAGATGQPTLDISAALPWLQPRGDPPHCWQTLLQACKEAGMAPPPGTQRANSAPFATRPDFPPGTSRDFPPGTSVGSYHEPQPEGQERDAAQAPGRTPAAGQQGEGKEPKGHSADASAESEGAGNHLPSFTMLLEEESEYALDLAGNREQLLEVGAMDFSALAMAPGAGQQQPEEGRLPPPLPEIRVKCEDVLSAPGDAGSPGLSNLREASGPTTPSDYPGEEGDEGDDLAGDRSKRPGMVTVVSKKRDRSRDTGGHGEGYRERWLKKHPRRLAKTWLSEVCSVCHHDSPGLVVCMGPCLRAFHPWCIGVPSEDLQARAASGQCFFCPECDTGMMRCFVCGEFSKGYDDPFVQKCSLGVCGRFYHRRCVEPLSLTRIAQKGQHFYCPQHYCSACGKSGDGVDMVKCMRCPVAYHSSCMTRIPGVRRVKNGTKLMLCAAHEGQRCPAYVPPPLPDPEALQRVIREGKAQGLKAGSRDKRVRNTQQLVTEPPPSLHSLNTQGLPPAFLANFNMDEGSGSRFDLASLRGMAVPGTGAQQRPRPPTSIPHYSIFDSNADTSQELQMQELVQSALGGPAYLPASIVSGMMKDEGFGGMRRFSSANGAVELSDRLKEERGQQQQQRRRFASQDGSGMQDQVPRRASSNDVLVYWNQPPRTEQPPEAPGPPPFCGSAIQAAAQSYMRQHMQSHGAQHYAERDGAGRAETLYVPPPHRTTLPNPFAPRQEPDSGAPAGGGLGEGPPPRAPPQQHTSSSGGADASGLTSMDSLDQLMWSEGLLLPPLTDPSELFSQIQQQAAAAGQQPPGGRPPPGPGASRLGMPPLPPTRRQPSPSPFDLAQQQQQQQQQQPQPQQRNPEAGDILSLTELHSMRRFRELNPQQLEALRNHMRMRYGSSAAAPPGQHAPQSTTRTAHSCPLPPSMDFSSSSRYYSDPFGQAAADVGKGMGMPQGQHGGGSAGGGGPHHMEHDYAPAQHLRRNATIASQLPPARAGGSRGGGAGMQGMQGMQGGSPGNPPLHQQRAGGTPPRTPPNTPPLNGTGGDMAMSPQSLPMDMMDPYSQAALQGSLEMMGLGQLLASRDQGGFEELMASLAAAHALGAGRSGSPMMQDADGSGGEDALHAGPLQDIVNGIMQQHRAYDGYGF